MKTTIRLNSSTENHRFVALLYQALLAKYAPSTWHLIPNRRICSEILLKPELSDAFYAVISKRNRAASNWTYQLAYKFFRGRMNQFKKLQALGVLELKEDNEYYWFNLKPFEECSDKIFLSIL